MKRKRRNTMAEKKIDLNIPISIELLGTEDDPCFAKLFDPRENECKRCGDAEICSIAMGQKNHILRMGQEKKGNFKDVEELDIVKPVDKKVLRKSIRNRVREMARMGPVDIQEVINDVFASYGKDGFTQVRIKRIIRKMEENSSHLVITKNVLKWKS